jgi:hypothetical protein
MTDSVAATLDALADGALHLSRLRQLLFDICFDADSPFRDRSRRSLGELAAMDVDDFQAIVNRLLESGGDDCVFAILQAPLQQKAAAATIGEYFGPLLDHAISELAGSGGVTKAVESFIHALCALSPTAHSDEHLDKLCALKLRDAELFAFMGSLVECDVLGERGLERVVEMVDEFDVKFFEFFRNAVRRANSNEPITRLPLKCEDLMWRLAGIE